MRPILLFRNFHLSFSFRENDRFFIGREFRFRDTATLCYGNPTQILGLLMLSSPFGERYGSVVSGYLGNLPRQPKSDIRTSHAPRLLFEKKPFRHRTDLTQNEGVPPAGVLFLCGFIIPYFPSAVKGFWGISYILYTKIIKEFYNFGQNKQKKTIRNKKFLVPDSTGQTQAPQRS